MPPGGEDDVTARAGDAEEMEVEESSRTARASRASSEHKGVCWIKSRKKWRASTWANGKTVYLGLYVDEDDAARAVADFQEHGTVSPPRRGVTSEHKGVSWNVSKKKWKASMWANGKQVYLGYYVDEDDAARAVADFQEHGTVPPRRGVTSEHKGVSWNVSAKKWLASMWANGKQVHLGLYVDEEDAARAVADFQQHGTVPPRRGVTSEHKGVSWDVSKKKWKASIWANGKTVHLGLYVDEDDAAQAVADFQEHGTMPPRRGVTSEHKGVSWNVSARKWVAQTRANGKQVYLGLYVDEDDAARAVADFQEHGTVPRRRAAAQS